MLIERNEGMLERYLVSGITGVEILFSHVATQFLVMVFQAALVLIFAFAIYGLTINGSIVTVVALTILSGLCGMCFGFVVSSAVDNERTATYMAMGSFLPIVMLCGIIWPIEGMYSGLKLIAYFLPLTYPTESLRSLLQKGWTVYDHVVYMGFTTLIVWSLIFLTISILLLKFKKGWIYKCFRVVVARWDTGWLTEWVRAWVIIRVWLAGEGGAIKVITIIMDQ